MHPFARLAAFTALAIAAPACSQAQPPDLPAEPRTSTGAPQWSARQPETAASVDELLDFYRTDDEASPLAPRRDCERVEGGAELMRELARIALGEETDSLRQLATPDMRYGLQSGQFDWGEAEFVEQLETDPASMRRRLARNVALGCGVNESGQIVLPWFVSTTPPARSRYGSALVIGERVPVFTSLQSLDVLPRQATWEWAQLTYGSHSVFEPLQPVRLADDTEGWIDPDRMRSVWTDRWVFEQRDGAWQLVAVVDEWDARLTLD